VKAFVKGRYGHLMPRPDRSNALDHIVVIMFENRSFDNLLGRLYEPGEVASFAGVAGLDLSNPVPDWAAGTDLGTAPRLVPYGTAVNSSGVRVPAIAVSPWIGEQTVVNDQYRHTSVIRTLRKRWQLGAPLTARDAAALDIAPVLSLDTPRDPDDWPDVTPRPVPAFSPERVPLEARLKGLCKAACFPVLALAKDMGLPARDIDQDEAIGRADAIALINEVFGHMFPGLHAG
jgi:phospholipase C